MRTVIDSLTYFLVSIQIEETPQSNFDENKIPWKP